MKTTSQNELERYLTGYLTHVNSWCPDEGDSFLMLNCRELLSKHEKDLTEDQKKQLLLADKIILSLANESYKEDTPSIGFLKLLAEVINGHLHSQTA